MFVSQTKVNQPANGTQSGAPQVAETAMKCAGKKRRASQLMPELRDRIPALFDRGMLSDRIAEQFGLPRVEILEDLIRDTRRMLPRRSPSFGLHPGGRRAA